MKKIIAVLLLLLPGWASADQVCVNGGSANSCAANAASSSSDLEVGTTAITSGGSGQILFEDGSNLLDSSASFTVNPTTFLLSRIFAGSWTNATAQSKATSCSTSGTAAAGGGCYDSILIENAAGEVEERGRVEWSATDVTDGAEASELRIRAAMNGVVTKVVAAGWDIGGATSGYFNLFNSAGTRGPQMFATSTSVMGVRGPDAQYFRVIGADSGWGIIFGEGATASATYGGWMVNSKWRLGNIDSTPDSTLELAPYQLTTGTMTVERRASVREVTHSFTWTNAMVVALGAGLSGDITVATLPAKTQVVDAAVIITGTGAGTTTLTVSCGRTASDYIDYIVASDAQAAANTVYGDASGERGTNLTGYDLPSYTTTTAVICQFVSTVANLDQVTGSTGRVILTTRLLP